MTMFAIKADFVLAQGANELGAQEAAIAIQRAIPLAIIDWSKGRARAQKRLDELIAMGCPEIIYRGQQRLVDKMFHVEIQNHKDHTKQCGYSFGFTHYDGCISLASSPYNVDSLKRVAKEFAAALSLEFLLYADFGNLEVQWYSTSAPESHQARIDADSQKTVISFGTELAGWDEVARPAIARWHAKLVDSWKASSGNCPTVDRIVDSLVASILSIGSVNRWSRVHSPGEYEKFVIEYADWTAKVTIPHAAIYFEPNAE